MNHSTKLFRIFGIDIQLHFSWWFIFFLLTWSLSTSFFPPFFPGYTQKTYWLMGILASLLLFISVLLHELSHSLVAKAKKIQVKSITLFFFGGVAGITKEDMKPSSEFQMAIAGPLFSLLLGTVFYFIYKLDVNGFWTAITFYLYQLNFTLGIFNLIPGFPLDGGRAFRAILYAYFKDLTKATRIAAGGGKLFAVVLIMLGIVGLFGGAGGGIWFILIGGFLYFIAGVSYEQVVVKEVLSSISIKELMVSEIPTIDPAMSFEEFLQNHARKGDDLFFVKNDTFAGIIDVKRLQPLSQKMQQLLKVKQLSLPLSQIKGITTKSNAYNAFHLCNEQNVDVLPVLEGKKTVGFVTRKAITNRLVLDLRFGFLHKKVLGGSGK